jgi:hypothetical protein
MKRLPPVPSLAAAALLFSAPALSQELGSRCEPGEAAPADSSLVCQATEEWDLFPAALLNAKKGDSVLTFGTCDFVIGHLLRAVEPPQFYTHVGMMTENHYQIRHSTVAISRVIRSCEEVQDGCGEDPLRYMWPGAITQSVRDAFEGGVRVEPDGHTTRVIGPFRTDSLECDGESTSPLILRPSLENEETVRPQLEAAADRLLDTPAHYRLFAYTKGDISRDEHFNSDNAWADGWIATMCSSYIWTALQEGDLTLEGERDPADPREPDPLRDGLYLYTAEERLAAGETLYDYLWNLVYEKETDFFVTVEDAADDVANQVINCFGTDACEQDAKDSETWREEPGEGSTVSPEDMRHWDPYDDEELPNYQPARYVRAHTWQRRQGPGALEGTVLFEGDPVAGASVSVSSDANLSTTTDGEGRFRFPQVPGGLQLVEARRQMARFNAEAQAERLVEVRVGATSTVELHLSFSSLEPPETRFHRLVTVRGTMKIVDDDWPWAPDRCEQPVDRSFLLDPVNHPNDEFTIERCCDDEVKGELRVILRLGPQQEGGAIAAVPVHVDVRSKLHESTVCEDEEEDHENRAVEVGEDDEESIIINLSNGSDKVDIDLVVTNRSSPGS